MRFSTTFFAAVVLVLTSVMPTFGALEPMGDEQMRTVVAQSSLGAKAAAVLPAIAMANNPSIGASEELGRLTSIMKQANLFRADIKTNGLTIKQNGKMTNVKIDRLVIENLRPDADGAESFGTITMSDVNFSFNLKVVN